MRIIVIIATAAEVRCEGGGGGVLGVALIVLVLRALLAQAVARDVEATQLQAELDEVI